MVRRIVRITIAFMALLLAGCGEDEQAKTPPPPQELTREAVGNYCGMIVADHPGPKAQLFLKKRADPIWFSSVRDAIAFTMLPEEPKAIAAIYVNDMGKAMNWESPEPGTWIEARNAWFVVGSSRTGGMGAPETVPFSEKTAAETFAAKYGGRLVRFEDIPSDYVLSSAGGTMRKGMTH
jgi:copper chaperone NosL